jgi:hypothetical protein
MGITPSKSPITDCSQFTGMTISNATLSNRYDNLELSFVETNDKLILYHNTNDGLFVSDHNIADLRNKKFQGLYKILRAFAFEDEYSIETTSGEKYIFKQRLF